MIKNEEKITKEFCQGKGLIFFPKTVEDAQFIQDSFILMGFKWGDPDTLSDCVSNGMVLKEGLLYSSPNTESRTTGFLCTSDQFSVEYKSDRELIMQLFNQVADLGKMVNAIYDELQPKVLDKPVLKKPGTQP